MSLVSQSNCLWSPCSSQDPLGHRHWRPLDRDQRLSRHLNTEKEFLRMTQLDAQSNRPKSGQVVFYKTTKIIQSSGVWTKFDHFSHDCWLKLRLAGLGSLPRPPETYARIPKKSWYPSNHRHGWPLKPMAPAGLLPFLGNLQMTWPAAMDLKDQFVRVEPTLL
jgi:hypothetical protein